MTTILVVEDEEAYRSPLEYSLKREGYEVIGVGRWRPGTIGGKNQPYRPDSIGFDAPRDSWNRGLPPGA